MNPVMRAASLRKWQNPAFRMKAIAGMKKTWADPTHIARKSASMKGNRNSLKHGHTSENGNPSSTYYSWFSMISRCKYRQHKSYQWYGGRGIKVCSRWRDFQAFLADMGERPPGLSIDRIDNDGDYEPSNCRWVTMLEQHRHQRKAQA